MKIKEINENEQKLTKHNKNLKKDETHFNKKIKIKIKIKIEIKKEQIYNTKMLLFIL